MQALSNTKQPVTLCGKITFSDYDGVMEIMLQSDGSAYLYNGCNNWHEEATSKNLNKWLSRFDINYEKIGD